ncbi:hypothetical protein MOO46_07325 (plasmid) [Apilactobacillus apisilvae]|uniref:Uncharacterized protein n=1 Tax=Apilactobacillus apisilvae TaxID=2923364 RepID=A0ABY4PJH3_9LACO|nr:hypothetical protein [Apilactobacillus apisilvae]UQS85795.1 hypothetical protein MOO46_07325 [Apilactobacillus apisilvae]
MFQTQLNISDDAYTNDILNKLPAYRNQLDDSNNQKFLNIIAELFNDGKNDLISIYDLTRIKNAKGKILTDLAKEYGITRIDNDDDFLRFELNWQVLKSKTPTTINGIKTLISVLLNIDVKQFDIVPTENPQEVEVINIPFDFNSGSHSNLKRRMLSDSIQSILPVETNLKDIQYQKQSYGNYYIGILGVKNKFKESEVVPFGNL